MKLSLPFLEKKENLSYFLVLILRHNKASAVIFEESAGTVKVINQVSESFKDSIEKAPDEELLTVLDKAISKAESVLPDNIETQKTIFGLKENWIEDNKIKKEYLGKLKKISEELGLIPIGFLITTEAIAHFLAIEEGAPVSAILAEIDRDYAATSLIRAGKIVEVKSSKIEGSPAETIDKLLKHFENVEVLPSRVIIFGADKDLTQEFIGHQWSKTLPFLHLPQIANLEQGFDAKAVLSGAASEMGFQVLGAAPTKPATSKTTEPAEENLEEEKHEGEIPEEQADVSEGQSPDFGFVKDKDIAKEVPPPIAAVIEEIPEELQIQVAESKPLSQNAAVILAGATSTLGKLLSTIKTSISKLKLPSSFPVGNKIIILPIGIVAILLLVFIFYLFGRHATVTLAINGQKISQEKNVAFVAGVPTDASKSIIQAQFQDVLENGSASTNATGTKDIGTPSKGTVTVFNSSTNSSRTIDAGTIITSSNDLKFTLDKSVTVASASGDFFSGTTPGKANVNVTAADIGTNFNLPSNTKFSFAADSSIAAKNDNPFSGGTKKNITVVSKDDIAKLESDLAKSLEQKAKDDIGKKTSGNMILLPVFISETLSNKSLDKNAGDEASKVTLKADVNYKSIVYSKSDLVSFAKDILKPSDNLVLDEGRISTDVKNIKVKSDNEVGTTLGISGFLVPKIDQSSLAKKISGKNIKDAQVILASISQISSTTIKITPNIPLLPKTLPAAGKIKFVINSNE